MPHTPSIRQLIDLATIRPEHQSSLLREYLEIQTYQTLLEDARLEYLMKQYGEKIKAFYTQVQQTTPQDIQQAIENRPVEDIAGKVLDYIASFDPTPNHQYTQWLVIRWLKNGYHLEDLPRARESLELFGRVKSRLQQKDINGYRTLADLDGVLQSFAQQPEQAVSANDEKRQLARKMSRPPEANVIYDDAQIKIVNPLTREASCYWGTNTKWCTAYSDPTQNQFDYYSKQSPLYVVLIKAENKRYQLWFGSNGQYMNELDRPIDLKKLLEEYPAIFDAIGEERFLNAINLIGLSWFKHIDAAWLNGRSPSELAHAVSSAEDLEKIPVSIQKTLTFQQGLVQSNYNTGRYVDRASLINLLPEAYYRDHLKELVTFLASVFFAIPRHLITPELTKVFITRYPARFVELPDDLKTRNLAHDAAKNLGWRAIFGSIPEEWRDDVVMEIYWKSRTNDSGDNTLHLSELPHAYWTKNNIVNLLRKHPGDMEKHIGVLTNDIVMDICRPMLTNTNNVGERIEDNFIDKIPMQFRSEKLLDAIKTSDKHRAGNNKYLGQQWLDSRRSLYAKFPPRTWDKETALLGISKLNDLFDLQPELLKDHNLVSKFLEDHVSQAETLPADVITDSVIGDLLSKFSYSSFEQNHRKVIKSLAERNLISENLLVDLAHSSSSTTGDTIFENIPQELRSFRVYESYAAHGHIPVKELPDSLKTPEIIKIRVAGGKKEFSRGHGEDIRDIPASIMSPEYMIELAKREPFVIGWTPDGMYSEPLLWIWLSRRETDFYSEDSVRHFRSVFSRFPKETWSDRTVAEAIAKNLLSPNMSYYEEFKSDNVARAIIERDPRKLSEFPALFNTEDYVKIARTNPNILLQLDPANITEPMIFAAVDGIDEYTKIAGKYTRKSVSKEVLDHLPRNKFSKRVYGQLVGQYIPLKDIPAKFQTDAIRLKAVIHSPKNILAIKNPSTWLNQHMDKPDPKSEGCKKMEHYGLIWAKKTGWVDVRNLPRETLDTGYQVAIKQAVENKRVYLFSPKGNFLLFLYTEKSNVVFPYKEKEVESLAKLIPSIVEICRKYLNGFYIKNLNDLHIYGRYGSDAATDDQITRRNFRELSYIEVEHNGGTRCVLYLNDKPLVSFVTTARKDIHNRRGRDQVETETVNNYQKVLEHGFTIANFVRAHWRNTNSYTLGWDIKDLGIITDSKGDDIRTVCEQKIGRLGDLIVYCTTSTERKKIAIFDLSTKRRVALATVKKNLRGLYDIDTGYGHGEKYVQIHQLLDKIEAYLAKTKNITGIIPFDKD